MEAFVVDVVACNGALIRKRNDKNGGPLILARVAHHKRCDDNFEGHLKRQKAVEAVGQTMPRSGAIQQIKAGSPQEMTLLLNYFKKNSKLLSNEFVQRFEK